MANKEIRDWLLGELKKNNDNKSIRLPGGIQFNYHEADRIVYMTMKAGIARNMQENGAAFEGWALAIKANLGELVHKVELSWNKDDEPKNSKLASWRHFNRFIYRVDTFERDYGNWFTVKNRDVDWDKRRADQGWGDLILNEMGERKVVEDVDHSKPESEHDLEEFLIKNGGIKLKEFIQSQFGIEFEDIKNQYPVGVFSNEVKNENAVFTGGKSAIDMYAKGKDGSFNIFELKAEENVQIGIVSELFFYSSLIRDTIEGKFKFKNTRNEFENSKHVNAFFLASRLHPLITDEVLDMLNIPNNKITYGKIIYTFMKSKSGPIFVL